MITFPIENISEQQWYRQQSESRPYFIYGPCRHVLQTVNSPEFIISLTPDEIRAYLTQQLMRAEAEAVLERERKTPGAIDTDFREWVQNVGTVNGAIYAKVDTADFEQLSEEELLEMQNMLARISAELWDYLYIDVFDVDAESLVERELVEEGITLTDEERATMMKQEQLIVHQAAEKDLLNIALLVRSTPGALNTFTYIQTGEQLHRLALYPFIEKAIQQYQQQYHWIHNGWGHTQPLSLFDCVEQVQQLLQSSRDLQEEYEQLERFAVRIQEEKTAIADKHGMSDWLRRLFHLFGVLSYWRDGRKAQIQQQNGALERIGTEVARRSGLSWEEVALCDPRKITELPVTKELVESQRTFFTQHSAFYYDGGKIVHIKNSPEVAAAIEETITSSVTEIRGMIACPGKARGPVVVIRKESEFAKMEEGAILVTSMTRPEFVPLMKQAAAIVTDEGGITSHAAVVSRELKIPCVIGTQVASSQLKDGDMVLVNADHGVVTLQNQE